MTEGPLLKTETTAQSFASFMETAEPSLRKALIAGFGIELGREATADALAYGWENWERVRAMDNPTGYLFRVGHNKARHRRKRESLRVPVLLEPSEPAWFEPDLLPALRKLSDRQRIVVALVHAFDYSMREVAELLGITKSSVQMHEARAMRKLRRDLGVQT
jgi:RNA polymerase sigma factor (sigma-70 family)